jgi:Rrf2 family protein
MQLAEGRVVHIPAKADYAIRALVALAAVDGGPLTAPAIARIEDIPPKFLDLILSELRRSGFIRSIRGPEGGYVLAMPAKSISLADIIRVLDGPLAEVRGIRPEATIYSGPSAPLRDVWLAARVALRKVLETTSIDDVAKNHLSAHVRRLVADPDALFSHPRSALTSSTEATHTQRPHSKGSGSDGMKSPASRTRKFTPR